MRGLIVAILSIVFLNVNFSYAQRGSVIVIGTIHFPSKNFNSDTLLNILSKVKPDIILLELDSTLFSKTFDNKLKLMYSSKENEPVAVARYLELSSSTSVSYFDFPGRDRYRNQRGIKKAENKTEELLDSLYHHHSLSKHQQKIVGRFYSLTEELNSYAEKNALQFNNAKTDDLAKRRQFYQYHKIRTVINKRKEFSDRFVTTNLGNKVSIREGYGSLCDFWDIRNKTMAANIVQAARNNPTKRVVVLTGFFHRYYLKGEILRLDKNLKLHEYYQMVP